MPGYIQMEACYSNRLSAGNVGWLIIDEDDFVGSKRQRFQRQCISARVRLENFRTSGVDDGIHPGRIGGPEFRFRSCRCAQSRRSATMLLLPRLRNGMRWDALGYAAKYGLGIKPKAAIGS